MKLLAIDTSGDDCSAALLIDGALTQRLTREPRRHGALILAMMDELLAEADLPLVALDALAFARGPGSFTGVRIAASVVQGAAFGADLPVVGVSTLAALAQGQQRIYGSEAVLAAFDARMGELYWGAFRLDAAGLMGLRGEEQVAGPGRVVLPEEGRWAGAGSGWGVHRRILSDRLGVRLDRVDPDAFCEARDVAELAVADLAAGAGLPAERALPRYLRDRVTAVAGGGR
jgi:tRNA threonylcarbamoyladenosine biosynthesis protein TsaB